MITRPSVVVVDPTADLQAAIDSAVSGGEIRLNPGVYTPTSATGWVIDKPLTICASGMQFSDQTSGVTLAPYDDPTDGTKNSRVLTIASHRVSIYGINIAAASLPAAGTGDGIYFQHLNDGVIYFGVVISNVNIGHMGRDGIHLESSGTAYLNDVKLDTVESSANRGCGVYLKHCGSVTLKDVTCQHNYAQGIYLDGQQSARMYGCYVQDNMKNGSGYDVGSQVTAILAHGLVVSGCSFEDFAVDANTGNALTLYNCRAVTVESCQFINNVAPDALTAATSIRILGGTNMAHIGSCSHDYVKRTVSIAVELGGDEGSNRGLWVEGQSVGSHDVNNPAYMDIPNENVSSATGAKCSGYGFVVIPVSGAYMDDTTGRRGAAGGLRLPNLANVAGRIGDELDGGTPDTTLEGTVIYNKGRHVLGVMGGTTWQLANNAPSMTSVQRDALTWQEGDMIVNTTTHKLQVRTPTTWVDITTSAAPDS